MPDPVVLLTKEEGRLDLGEYLVLDFSLVAGVVEPVRFERILFNEGHRGLVSRGVLRLQRAVRTVFRLDGQVNLIE